MGRTNKAYMQAMELWLRTNFKTPYPVKVKWGRLGGHGVNRVWGTTERKGRRLVITMDPTMVLTDQAGILIHEWAHAVVWRHETIERSRVHHDDEWGLAYAKIYREWHDKEE